MWRHHILYFCILLSHITPYQGLSGSVFSPKGQVSWRSLGLVIQHVLVLNLICLVNMLDFMSVVLLATSGYLIRKGAFLFARLTPYPRNLASASHMKRHLECAEQAKSTSNLTKYCACHAKCISWLIRVTYETSFRMRGASNVNLQPQQILRLPRKMNLMFDPRLICHMKLHFQCAEQAMSTSNLSKYCACHEIFKFKIAAETLWIASANIKTIRG